MQIKAVAFDAFGTILEITDRRNVLERIAAAGHREGQNFVSGMQTALGPYGMAQHYHCHGHVYDELADLEVELYYEVASCRPFPEARAIMKTLKKTYGVKIAVVSNLGMPFGIPVQCYFHDLVDEFILSYEQGFSKPDPVIFNMATHRLGLHPSEILMVGDKQRNDVDAAKQVGMNAILIDRSDFPQENSIPTLYGILNHMK